MKRTSPDSESYTSHTTKRQKAYNTYESNVSEPISANDRFAGSIYKGRILVNKTPQKIKFDDDTSTTVDLQDGSRPLSRKKSVTFTPETKVEDGASGQTFAKLWLLGTPPIQTNQATQPETPASEQATPTKTLTSLPHTKDAQPKQPRKGKGKKGKKASDEQEERIACIKYLEQFHNDKANWKFNKSRQNDILRHIWNTEQLPSTSDDALVAYVQGLQGAASQQRLIEGAVSLLDALMGKHKNKLDSVDHTDPGTKPETYAQAIEHESSLYDQGEPSDDGKRDLQAAKRAHRLLTEALWQFYNPERPDARTDATSPQQVAGEVANVTNREAVKKSRKNRTAALSESDSSDSSSESESDSDESSNSSVSSESASASESESDSEENSSDIHRTHYFMGSCIMFLGVGAALSTQELTMAFGIDSREFELAWPYLPSRPTIHR